MNSILLLLSYVMLASVGNANLPLHDNFDAIRGRELACKKFNDREARARFQDSMRLRLAKRLYRGLSGKSLNATAERLVTPGHYEKFDVVLNSEPPTFWAGEVTEYQITYVDKNRLCRLVGRFATPDYLVWRWMADVEIRHFGCVPESGS